MTHPVTTPRPLARLTDNIYTETGTRGSDPSFVVTSAGVVVIDTPQLPTHAIAMRRQAESHGPIRYVVNTEHHVDHIFGNYYFRGAGLVVHHQGVYDNFMTVYPELDPFAFAVDAVRDDDPDGLPLVPDRDEYYRDPNKGDIVFGGNLTLRVGDHVFELLHTPGHTPGQIAVHVPQERTVFTGDTIFSDCQTWLMTSDVDQWMSSLAVIEALDVDRVVPGHGPVTSLEGVRRQRATLLAWKSAVAEAIAKGWSREETVARVSFASTCETDVGLSKMMDYIQTLNAGSLYDKLLSPAGPGVS